jgi:DNA-binding FadR family transcriptional regulator
MLRGILPYTILQYVVDQELGPPRGGEPVRLGSMDQLADELGISRGKLREELIAAQAYGVVRMRPGDGTYVQPFDFYSAVRTPVLYATAYDWRHFDQLYRLRASLESAFWDEGVRALEERDELQLLSVVETAEQKLGHIPAEIPHKEHRDFHTLVFRRLDNVFVRGLLNAYWDAYEAVGLHRYFDYGYYAKMWSSHRAIAEAIQAGEHEKGRRVLQEHFTLLQHRLHGEAPERRSASDRPLAAQP